MEHIKGNGDAAAAASSKGDDVKQFVMMHGILGSKRNWRTPARRLIQRLERRGVAAEAYTVDHRGHGESHGLPPPNDLPACARDLHSSFEQLGVAPHVIMGHSFGGKVALEYLKQAMAHGWHLPRHFWVLDSLPTTFNPKLAAQQTVSRIIELVTTMDGSFTGKEQVTEILRKHHVTGPVIQWLLTNVVPAKEPGKYTWNFDPPVIRELFADLCTRDYIDTLRELSDARLPTKVHLLRAGKNPAWLPDVMERVNGVLSENVLLHDMPHVGHWVHAEDLEGLLDIVLGETDL